MKKGFDNETLTFLLLHSLPKHSTWENFMVSILGLLPDSDVLSFCTVSNCLTMEDVCQYQPAESETQGQQVGSHHNFTLHNTDNCFTLKKMKQEEEKGGKSSVDKRKLKNRGHEKAHKAKDGSEYDSNTSESDEEQAHVTTALKRCISAYLGGNLENHPSNILMDSRASTSLTPNRDSFGDDSIVYTTGKGMIVLQQDIGNISATTTIKHALLISSFKVTLLSVCHLMKGGYYVTF
ncbi:hypothetical protein M422DRAFT_192870 [Sphaerobolus stellatus SS14]|uniref:Unplaced genomic scaffold SPHSTscaffold_318, whole genome shotgun sequence n=1 Tax=Sphaerobolus stellatus (strain SS14) TaxID=990650 RepID=A0A0C9TVU8_SPHS4|nr:hypothetical protein M422DRAFT_192864 [Sphaerobolus stellatus SS14]KIJ25905.1 hypothetical protein M422DRAFT_192870 [Sphaerobolus stellatus SS14]